MSDQQSGFNDTMRGNSQLGQNADYEKGREEARRQQAIDTNRSWTTFDGRPAPNGGAGAGPGLEPRQALILVGAIVGIGVLGWMYMTGRVMQLVVLGGSLILQIALLFAASWAAVPRLTPALRDADRTAISRARWHLVIWSFVSLMALHWLFATMQSSFASALYKAAHLTMPLPGLLVFVAMLGVATAPGALALRGAAGWRPAWSASAAVIGAMVVLEALLLFAFV